MVGDRYRLKRRQRNAVARSACSDAEWAHRLVRCREPEVLTGHWVDIDGFNVLISVEGLLGGAYLFVGRDCAYRDVDPVQGTYRMVAETAPAIRLIRDTVVARRVAGVTWWLDAHVSNVGRLKSQLAALAPSALGWNIHVSSQVDEALAASGNLVATSDSAVLDQVSAWCSIEQMVCMHFEGEPNVCHLRGSSTSGVT
jgi:hypothetical protein